MQRTRELVAETPNTTLGIVGVAFAVAMLILLPRVFPDTLLSAQCSELANPIAGGNNNSILASRSADLMQLNVEVTKQNISVNESLDINVSFNNPGVGAITLFLIPEETLLRNDGSQGLQFEIRRMPDGALFSEPAVLRPPVPQRDTFAVQTLHVLGARQSCMQSFEFTTARLSNLGLPAGNYTIQAVYRNPFAGNNAVPIGATATPIFPNQGVYTTFELRSNTVDFSIGLVAPGTVPTPAPGG